MKPRRWSAAWILAVLALVLAVTPAFASDELAPTFATFAKNYGAAATEEISHVEPALDGGFLAVGSASGDLLLVRLNQAGGVVWSKRLGGTGTEAGRLARATSDGGFIVAAETSSFGAGAIDLWVLKLDAEGNIAWQIAYGTANDDPVRGIELNPAGGYWLATKMGNAVILQLDALGVVLGQRRYGVSPDTFPAIRETSEGGLLLTGQINYSVPNGVGSDPVVVKLDASGNPVWQQRFVSGSRFKNDLYAVDGAGGSATLLWAEHSNSGSSRFVVELDSTGAVLWRSALNYGGRPTAFDRTPDGGTLVGHATSEIVPRAYVTKVDAAGYSQWSFEYGQAQGMQMSFIRSLRPAVGGGYVIGATTQTFAPGDLWVARTDEGGAVAAACQAGRAAPGVMVFPWSLPSTVEASVGQAVATAVSFGTTATPQAYTLTTGECLNADDDADGVPNASDNCPQVANSQADADHDGLGDACDPCPADPANDVDGDAHCAGVDNCPTAANASQVDSDADSIGDACDACPADAGNDPDGDLSCALVDNCPSTFNQVQRDTDADGVGDLCDDCPAAADPAQTDTDGDGAGDACDCNPADPSDRRPAEVAGASFARGGGGATQVSWTTHAGDDSYAIRKGELSALGPGAYGDCAVAGLTTTDYVDPSVPALGHGFFYIVVARSAACGWGPLGYTSSEVERTDAGGLPPGCP